MDFVGNLLWNCWWITMARDNQRKLGTKLWKNLWWTANFTVIKTVGVVWNVSLDVFFFCSLCFDSGSPLESIVTVDPRKSAAAVLHHWLLFTATLWFSRVGNDGTFLNLTTYTMQCFIYSLASLDMNTHTLPLYNKQTKHVLLSNANFKHHACLSLAS